MSNLLDKASIILTPTAYNNGEALCVKPNDGSGDFDFSRNSAATRVNAQGLVENVQILSSNLVQNGDFSEEGAEEVSNGSFSQEGVQLVTNGDFTNNIDGWLNYISVSTWDNGTIKTTCTLNAAWIRQNNVVTANKYYKVTFKAKASNISQNIKIYNGTFTDTGLSFDEVDVYQEFTYYLYTTVTDIIIGQQTVSVGDTINFDNVSCVEVGQDWTLGTGVSIGENKAVFTSTPSGQSVSQNAVASQIPNGTSVKVSFEVLSISSGSFGVYFSGSLVGSLNSVGVATFYFEKGTETSFYIRALGTTTGSITNISVKEVGQNWTFLGDFETDGTKAFITSASQYSQLTNQIGVNYLLSGKKYKLELDIETLSISGALAYRYTGGAVIPITSSDIQDGKYIAYFTMPSNGYFWLQTTGSYTGLNVEVDNISVIEITDDTSLPRINYEGFSYQDALGSELVVNGSFDNGSANWTVAGGNPIFENSSVNFVNFSTINSNNTVVELGKTYKITYTISNKVGNSSFGFFLGGWNVAQYQDVGTHSEIISVSSSSVIYIRNGNSNSSVTIDNVSVKEYLGQSVVPESGCGSWLWEPQSTNLVTDSQNYNSTYWGGQRGTLSDGGVGLFYLSPTSNVIKYEVTTTGFNQLYYRLPSAVTIGNTYTQQGYVKCDDAPYIIFQIQPLTGNPSIVWDNINNVVISSDPSIDSFNITSLNGWVKAEITYTATVASIYASLKTYFSTTTSNTQGVPIGTIAYQTFVQVEQQTYATSYIPTSGSTVTRNQDVCTNGGSLASINSTEGVLYAEIAINQNDNGGFRLISMTDASDSVRVGFGKKDNQAKWYIKILIGALNITSQAIDFQEGFQKIAIRYKSGDSGVYINGTKVITDTSNYVNTLIIDNVSFDFTGNAFPFYGKTKALAVWKEALSDQELTELTTI